MTYSCSVCGHEKTEQIPKLEHTHTYSDQWTSNDEYHWHGSSCGHESEISDKARHSWDNGVFKNGAECSPNAVIVYTCTICSAEKDESAVAHLYTEQERKTATCTENGYRFSISSMLIRFLDCFDEQKIYLEPWRVLVYDKCGSLRSPQPSTRHEKANKNYTENQTESAAARSRPR